MPEYIYGYTYIIKHPTSTVLKGRSSGTSKIVKFILLVATPRYTT
jgi:hypothetical protein